jgi:hypothetical protein
MIDMGDSLVLVVLQDAGNEDPADLEGTFLQPRDVLREV